MDRLYFERTILVISICAASLACHGESSEESVSASTAGDAIQDVFPSSDTPSQDAGTAEPDGTEQTDGGSSTSNDDVIAGEDGADATDGATDAIDAEDSGSGTSADGADSTDTADTPDGADTTEGADNSDIADSTDGTDSGASIDAADGTDSGASIDAADGTDSGASIDAADGTDSGASIDAADGTDSGASMDSADGTDSGASMDSADGTDSGPSVDSGTDGADSGMGMDGADGADCSDSADGSGDGGSVPGITCGMYEEDCGGVCKNTSVDPLNCGGCGVECAGGEVCSASGCTADGCLGTLVACNAACVNTMTDTSHCGGCGQACGAGKGCVSGACVGGAVLPAPAACNDFDSLVIPIGGADVCLGEQAQVSFTWAICSCEGINFSNEVLTDAYDSTEGPYVPGGKGGGIATNKGFASTNLLNVGGTLWSAGAAGVTMGNVSNIDHEFHSASNVFLTNIDNVGLNAYVNGHIMTSGQFSIGGTLTQSPTFSKQGNVSSSAYVSAPVTVLPPCKCAPNELLPIASTVSAHTSSQMNDNQAVGLNSGVLVNPPGPKSLVLPCGVYYLDGITSSHDVSIVATGNTALMIGGDVSISGKLYIVPAPGAELDVLISGTFFASNDVVLGSPNYPSAMRVYIGGDTAINMSTNVDIAAYLYAMKAVVNFSHDIDIFGGIAVGALSASNILKVHYDRAILSAAQDCAEPPVTGGADGGTATDGADGGSATDGDSGSSGATGMDGCPGASGMDGTEGATGADGTDGADGFDGFGTTSGTDATDPTACEDCRDCGNQACVDGYCGACTDNRDCCGPLVCVDGQCLSLGVISP